MTRYQHLATLLAERIEQGLYRHGEKLPSVRSCTASASAPCSRRTRRWRR
ncbi:bacterial regulatory s, gntR family protein [Escherichia coli 3-475-03_S3_C2]|nr:bacterial regulatory s, gntR family protein [Escherichia coli 3-475-03_S3_C2]